MALENDQHNCRTNKEDLWNIGQNPSSNAITHSAHAHAKSERSFEFALAHFFLGIRLITAYSRPTTSSSIQSVLCTDALPQRRMKWPQKGRQPRSKGLGEMADYENQVSRQQVVWPRACAYTARWSGRRVLGMPS